MIDEIAIIRSMYNARERAGLLQVAERRDISQPPDPSAWVTYGLGSVSQILPAYVVLADPQNGSVNNVENWMSGYLPPLYQGTQIKSEAHRCCTSSRITKSRPVSPPPSAISSMPLIAC